MNIFNLYKAILCCLLLLCLVGCSTVTAVIQDEKKLKDSLDNSLANSVEDPIDVSRIVFSTQDLDPVFQIVIGDKWHNYYDNQKNNQKNLLYLSDFVGNNPCPESFWLISPFYEPKEFFIRDYDSTRPIELSALAQTMTFKPIGVKKSATGWQLDPFISFKYADDDWSHLYNWASEHMLKVYSPPRGVGLVGLNTQEPISSSLLNYLNDQSLAVSSDNRMVAYIDKGYIVIQDLVTEEQKKWALTMNPESQSFQTFSTETLSWSPNGRYLIGSNYAYYDYYLAKVWMLDLNAGIIKHFNTLNSHAFLYPIWSPDSDQVVVNEFFRPYSEDYFGQWILLDIYTQKVTSLAGRDCYETNYDFYWENGDLQFSAKPSTTTQASDLYSSLVFSGVKLSPEERYLAVPIMEPFSEHLVTVTIELIDRQLLE